MAVTQTNKRALSFVLITVLIDMIGFGVIIPVTPVLIAELTGQGLDRAAIDGGWLMFLYAAMQFVFAPIIGNLSDRFGRRPVLLCSLAAFGIDYTLMGFAPTLWWLFVGRAVAGVTGATASTANAYIADVSAPEERAQNFGLIGAAFGIGFILGPAIGGYLGEYGSRVPFFAAAGMALANLIYGAIVLPESLPKTERRPFSLTTANPMGALRQMRHYPLVFGLLVVIVLHQIAHDANPAVWSYYTMLKFDWSTRELGYSLAFLGLLLAVVQGWFIRVAIARLGERMCVYAGFLSMALGFVGFSLSSEGWMMYLFIVPFALGCIAMPALRGVMSNEVPDNEQGALQGSIASLVSLTAIFTPILMTQLFGLFSSPDAAVYFPGAPFFLAGVLVLACVAWSMRMMAGAPAAAVSQSDPNT